MRYKVVITSRDCYDAHQRCLLSVIDYAGDRVQICVVDDASNDPGQPELDRLAAIDDNVIAIRNADRLGAMRSQVNAIQALDPDPEDVIVWLDGDDSLNPAYPVFDVLDRYYAAGNLLTYGSYVADPPHAGCAAARRYSPECERDNAYRNMAKYGLRFNHLRTVKAKLFLELGDSDFQHPNGSWFMAGCDAAVMIPCLELAGGRYARILQPLYIYTSDNPSSDWRVNSAELRKVHNRITASPPRNPL